MKRILLLLLLLLLAACQSNNEATLLPITIEEAYPGNMMDVTMIELIDGSSGERVKLTRKSEIDSLLHDIKDLVLEPDPNQEGRVGYLYRLVLYEEERLTLDFLPTAMNETYYLLNEQLHGILQQLYTEKYNKKE